MKELLYIKDEASEALFFNAILESKYTILNELKASGQLSQAINYCHRNTKVTPLIWVCSNGDLRMVDYLLQVSGIDINFNPLNVSALIQAAMSGHEKILNRLLEEPGLDLERDLPIAIKLARKPTILQRLNALLPVPAPELVSAAADIPLDQALVNAQSFTSRLQAIDYAGEIPEDLLCPISLEIMNDPISLSSGISYDRQALSNYFRAKATQTIPCPLTQKTIHISELGSASTIFIKNAIEKFVKEQEVAHAKREALKSNEPVEDNNVRVSEARDALFNHSAPARPAETSEHTINYSV